MNISGLNKKLRLNEINITINLKYTSKIIQRKSNSIKYIIIGSLSDIDSLLKKIDSELNFESLQDLEGEFCIFLISKSKLEIINDRFNSIPIYFSIEMGNYLISDNLSFFYKNSLKKIFNKETFFEFLFFQKIHGDKTILENVKKLPSSSKLTITDKEFYLKKYWSPVFSRDYNVRNSINKNAIKLSKLIKDSINDKTFDKRINEKIGLFLSGGMDTRSILAACTDLNLDAVTLGFSEDGEFKIAKLLTDLYSNFHHHFIKLSDDHFSKNFQQLVEISSCRYVFDHALFSNLNHDLFDLRRIFLNGYGLDFLFQGMYIPRNHYKIFGKPTYISKIRNSKKDFSLDYINNISFRFKNIDPFEFVKNSKKSHLESFIYNEIKKIEIKSKDSNCNSLTDFYDFTIINDISSHYSYSNVLSMKTICDVRTVAFNNSVFNFFLKLPNEHRLNARILKDTLKISNIHFSKIKSANHGMKITSNEYKMTAISIIRKLGRLISNSDKFRHPNSLNRTWPDRNSYISNDVFFRAKAEELIKSDYIDTVMPYLDRDKLNPLIREGIDGRSNFFGDTLLRLISIDQFLKSG